MTETAREAVEEWREFAQFLKEHPEQDGCFVMRHEYIAMIARLERAEAERDAARQAAHGLKERLGMLSAVHKGCTDARISMILFQEERDRAEAWILDNCWIIDTDEYPRDACADCGTGRFTPGHAPGCYIAELKTRHET